ncbi:MAG: 1-acyl-sn-glycerol-3-phosphate acyltransferase [Lachnospiraceae bacterium]|nr:1-acyl-sn-glycerol-3-phosphate acyltransferase [Lachnospiraceae bacterium]MBR3683300.1 1-acyl-sn-glycerol-3-phosphate acyltransferase [Lachnospiraceae bacterium]
MIRFLLTVFFVVTFLIVTIPIRIIEYIIGKFNMNLRDKSSIAIVNWAFRVCLKISGVRVTVIGEENVPKDVPVLYIGNHRSFFDILLTYVRVPRPTGYVAKKEMLKVPFLNSWMILVNCLFLDRKDIKKGMQTILAAIEKIKRGVSICIFPEGTRNKTPDTFLPFHDGSFKIAQKTGCPVIPMAINNSAAIFEDHFPKIKKTHVVIEYGAPIYIKDLPKEDQKVIGSYMQGVISDMYMRNKELV